MKDNKVDVIISQTRYEELLKKEDELNKLKDSKTILLGYKYLYLKSPMNVLMDEKDNLELVYHTGDGVPQEFITHTEAIKEIILEHIEILNSLRLEKIEETKFYITEQIEGWYEQGFAPEWSLSLLEWLGIKWDELRGKKK